MPVKHALRRRRSWVAAAVAAAALVAAGLATNNASQASADEVKLPPVGAEWDYQIGGAYEPPEGVEIVSRDREDDPASGLYNICYVNAFQVQPGERGDWPDDLFLRDENGKVIEDPEWDDEPILDISTDAKRQKAAEIVNGWIDGCADKGYDAVEPDNFDTFYRFSEYLTAEHAKAFIKLLSDHAHDRGLAIAQKNTAELAGDRSETGLDFAVAEECGKETECDAYATAYDNRVVVVEYEPDGFKKACAGWKDTLSVVMRDLHVEPPTVEGKENPNYVRELCDADS